AFCCPPSVSLVAMSLTPLAARFSYWLWCSPYKIRPYSEGPTSVPGFFNVRGSLG
ncbi:MAG: hypothetical protein QOI83_4906, partial [Streptomycetaceae bacterium]|nr:hypothetical protein [Streptomycetaceae bacterium]